MFYDLFKMMFLAMFGSREAADQAASNVAGYDWYVKSDEEIAKGPLPPGMASISNLYVDNPYDVTAL